MTETAEQPRPTPEEAREQLEQALFEIRRIIAGQDAMLGDRGVITNRLVTTPGATFSVTSWRRNRSRARFFTLKITKVRSPSRQI